jgi:hypothetical protein
MNAPVLPANASALSMKIFLTQSDSGGLKDVTPDVQASGVRFFEIGKFSYASSSGGIPELSHEAPGMATPIPLSPVMRDDTAVPPYVEDKEAYRAAAREVRPKLYQIARRYWQSVGDDERLALTDEQLDEVFWLIDHEGIPRLKSEQGTVDLPPDPFLTMAEQAHHSGADSGRSDISERSREILEAEFADYLRGRMEGDAR